MTSPFSTHSPCQERAYPGAPKALHPLPTWLTHFEGHKGELLSEFCPPSTIFTLLNSGFPATIRMKLPPVECSLPAIAPLLRFEDSRTGYLNTSIGDKDLRSKEDEDLYEWDAGCDSLKSDLDAGFELNCGWSRDHPPPKVTVGSSPYQGPTFLKSLPRGPPPSSYPHLPSFNPLVLATTQPL